MRKTIAFCDRCGADVAPLDALTSVPVRFNGADATLILGIMSTRTPDNGFISIGGSQGIDLCPDCWRALQAWWNDPLLGRKNEGVE